MALRTFIKMNQVSHLSDARYAAGMEVDQLGISIVPGQPGYLSPADVADIVQWIEGPQWVGEVYRELSEEDLDQVIAAYDLATFQVPLVASMVRQLQQADKRVVVALPEGPPTAGVMEQARQVAQSVDFFLVPAALRAQWRDHAAQLRLVAEVPTDAQVALAEAAAGDFYGLAVAGSQELAPGQMDADALLDLLEALELEV